MAESKEELKSLLMKVKEESEKAGLKLNIQTPKIMASSPFLQSVQFSSIAQACLNLCKPMDCSMPGFSCPAPTPTSCSNSCLLSWWCNSTISSSVILFFSCLQSFPASGSFAVSQFFASGGQVLELHLQHQSFQWIFKTDSPLVLTGLISLQSKRLKSLQNQSSKASILQRSAFSMFLYAL